MVEGRLKSRSLRRSQVRKPAGNLTQHYYRRMPGKMQCANCGDVLKGTHRAHSSKLSSTARSYKKPQRPFGGKLCSSCMRKTIINKFRAFSLSK